MCNHLIRFVTIYSANVQTPVLAMNNMAGMRFVDDLFKPQTPLMTARIW